MNFSLTITGSTPEELSDAISAVQLAKKATLVEATLGTVNRPSKPIIKEEQPKQTVKEEETKTESKPLTIEQVREAVQQKTQSGKREQVKNLLTKFSVTRVTDLQPEQYADFINQVQAL